MTGRQKYKFIAIFSTALLILICAGLVLPDTHPVRIADRTGLAFDLPVSNISGFPKEIHEPGLIAYPDSPSGHPVINRSVMKPWFITLDPMEDRRVGEQIIITGTTNIHPGTNFSLEIYPVIMNITIDPMTRITRETGTGAVGPAMIVEGIEPVNRWSCMMNSSSLPPSRYEIHVRDIGNGSGSYDAIDIPGKTRFNLTW